MWDIYTRWVSRSWTVNRRTGKKISKRMRQTTDHSPWEPSCWATSDRQPISPLTLLKSEFSEYRIIIHQHLLLLMFHPLFPPWLHPCILLLLPSSHCWCSTLPIYFHLAYTLHSPCSSLTGKAAVDDTHPAESSHAGSMDHSTQRGEKVP